MGWKISIDYLYMNLIHEDFNQHFTQKYSDHKFISLQNITNIYIWHSNLITISKSLMLFFDIPYALFSLRQMAGFLWYKIYFNMWRWILQNCATFNFGITRGSTCVLCCRSIPASRLWPKKFTFEWLQLLVQTCYHFLIDNSASCCSQDIQVFEN